MRTNRCDLTRERFTTTLLTEIALCICTILPGSTALASAGEIYNLDFAGPEVGNYQTVFGNPTVQANVGPLENALTFQAVPGYEQIRLEVGNIAPQYNIQYDVIVHNLSNSEYDFGTFLDFDSALSHLQNVSFHGGLNSIKVFSQYGLGSGILGAFSNDQVYHFDIALDFDTKLWSLSIDGVVRFSSAIDGANLQSVRLSMSPWVGGASPGPGTFAAIDNVVINAVPEPSPVALVIVGVISAIIFFRCQRVSQTRRNDERNL